MCPFLHWATGGWQKQPQEQVTRANKASLVGRYKKPSISNQLPVHQPLHLPLLPGEAGLPLLLLLPPAVLPRHRRHRPQKLPKAPFLSSVCRFTFSAVLLISRESSLNGDGQPESRVNEGGKKTWHHRPETKTIWP